MADALEHLRKLPAECAAVMGDRVVLIRRGAREPGTIPGLRKDRVNFWNDQRGITPDQVMAMIAGVTLGWDKPGADPDSYAEAAGDPVGPYIFEFQGEIGVQLKITAQSVEGAERQAREILQELADLTSEDHTAVMSAGPSDTLDLVDSTDPRA